MNKGLYIIAVILILSSALLFSGCKKQCELISYGDFDDGSNNSDGDSIYIPPADHDTNPGDTDGDLNGDTDSMPDGDTDSMDAEGAENSDLDIEAGEGGGDIEAVEYEIWDYEPDIDIEGGDGPDIGNIDPGTEVLKYDGRTAAEFSPFGFWEYWMARPEPLPPSVSRARLRTDYSVDAELLFYNSGTDVMSNPPYSSCIREVKSNLVFASYRLFNADGRADDFDNSFVLRRENKTGEELEISYFRMDLPEKPEEYEFKQVCLLPEQSTSTANRVNVIVAWVKQESEFKSYAVTQTFTANLNGTTPVLNIRTTEALVLLQGGFTNRTKMRIIESDYKLYLNAGSSIIRFDFSGVIESQNSIVYPVSGIESEDIIDFAVSPDGQYVSALSHLVLSGDEHETVWTLHKTNALNITEKIHRFGGSFDLYRTEFTLASEYAIVCNPDPTLNDDFYLMDMGSSTYRIKVLRQAVWGRPMFVGDPELLLQVYPVSDDGFKTTYNHIETRELSDIIDEAEILK